MGDPEIRTDEKVLLRTPGIYVKSIPFEGILTTKRIVLVDRAKNLLPPKEIPLATIKSVEAGENAIRDQILTLTVMARTGDTRQMILTFSRQEGGNRIKERDEWLRQVQANIGGSFENVIRKVIPGADAAPRRAEPPASPRITVVSSPPPAQGYPAVPVRREATEAPPVRKIIEAASPQPEVQEAAAPAQEHSVFCTRCGNRVPADSAFCNRCGTPIVAPGAVPASAAPSPSAPRPAAPPEPVTPAYTSRPIDRDIGTVEPLIERTPAPVPAEPAPQPIPDVPSSQAMEWDDDAEPRAPPIPVGAPASADRPRAPPAQKKGFLSGVFSSGKNAATPAPVPPPVPDKPGRSGGFAPSRNLLLGIGAVLVVLVVIAIGALVVYPMLTSGGISLPSGSGTSSSPSSSSSTTLTTGTIVVRETPAPVIPPQGVYVHVNYLGGFKGQYGMPPDFITTVPGNSGDRVWEVENANMTVIAEFEKLDGSAHELLVEIFRDGTKLTGGSTTTGHGYVRLSVDPMTGTAKEPVTSGGGSVAVTAAETTAAAATSVPDTTAAP